MSVFKKILTGILGDENAKKIRKYEVKVAEINALESKMSKLTDEEIRAKTQYFKDYQVKICFPIWQDIQIALLK